MVATASDIQVRIWDVRTAMEIAMLQHERPVWSAEFSPDRVLLVTTSEAPGLSGGFVDAITTDDFSGGACAAELLKTRTGRVSGFVVLAGPKNDAGETLVAVVDREWLRAWLDALAQAGHRVTAAFSGSSSP